MAEFEALRAGKESLKKTEIQYVEDCEKALLDSGRDYVVCTLDSNGKFYLANEKRVFKSGDYLEFYLSTKDFSEYFDPYYLCLYSNYPCNKKPDANITHTELKLCGGPYSRNNPPNINSPNMRGSCNITDLHGEYTILKVYMFPEMKFRSKEEFFSNLDKSMLVFNLTVVIE
jgi:hypothetical protein